MTGIFPYGRWRAAIGLIAAYALALQALFAAFAPMPAHTAAGDMAVLCLGAADAGDDSAPGPASAKLHCFLCVQASAGGAVLPEPARVALPRAETRFAYAFPRSESLTPPVPARAGPARAPPMPV